MSLRDRFFKPRWQHRDQQIRAEAVANSNDDALRRQLVDIARTDPSVAVRKAALQRLSRFDSLIHSAIHEKDAELKQLAQHKIWPMLLAAKPDDEGIRDLIAAWNGNDVIEQLASKGEHSKMRYWALEHCSGQGFLGQRAHLDPIAANRALALSKITQVSTLKQVAERLRKTDKQLYRQAQERLAELAGEQTDGHQEQAIRLCQQAEQLARGQGAGNLSGMIEQLQQDWQQLSHIEEKLQSRFQSTLEILKKALAGPQEESAAEDITETDANADAQSKTDSTTTVPEAVTASEQEDEADEQSVRPVFTELSLGLDQLIEKMAQDQLNPKAVSRWEYNWNKAWNPKAKHSQAEDALAASVQQRFNELQKQLEQRRAQRQERIQELNDGVAKLEQALQASQLQEATKIEQKCWQLMRTHQLRQPKSWRELHGQLEEKRQWLRWSNQQQRSQLIETVEALKEADMHPDALLERLRQARQEWQQLDEHERHAGLRGGHKAWPKFNAACNQVMETIKPFLDKRQQVRSERAQILQEMAQQSQIQLNSAELARPELLDLRRSLVKALRELSGVPHKQRQQIAEQLRAQLNQVDQRLDAMEKEAIGKKQKLIKTASELASMEPLKTAIQTAKNLQKQWRDAGFVRRGKEQKLWTEFRSHIDPLFSQLDAARQQREADQKAQHEDWQKLVEQAEQLSAQISALDQNSESDLLSQWQALKHEWQAAECRLSNLDQRWQQAAQAVVTYQRECQAAEQQVAYQAYWQTINEWQEWAQQQLDKGLASAPAADTEQQQSLLQLANKELDETLASRAEAAKNLCIAIEYLAGLDSPAAEQDARMSYQVERLAARMGQGEQQASPRDELRQLESQWAALIPLHPDHQEDLLRRFKTAWDVAIKTL